MYLSKQQLYESVENFKKYLKIGIYEYPLNVFELCDRISNVNIGKVPFKASNLRGIAVIAKNKSENHVILVNSNKTAPEMNYYGTHELMHIAIQRNTAGQTFKCFDKVQPKQDKFIEWQANEGAAEFLVPYKVLLPLIKNNYNSMRIGAGTYSFCARFSEVFGVSPIVMEIRLESLSYEIEQYLSGVSLDKIEILSRQKQIARGLHIISLPEQEDIRFFKIHQVANM